MALFSWPFGARDHETVRVELSIDGQTIPLRPQVDVGPLTPASGRDSWILNPRAPFRLTLTKATREVATQVRTLLEAPGPLSRGQESELLELLLRHNFRLAELDAYLATWRPRLAEEVARRKATHPEWARASQPDRRDILAEIEAAALAALPQRPPYSLLETLFRDEPGDLTADDALIARYPFHVLECYLDAAIARRTILQIRADDPRRLGYDQLADAGLAMRGAELDLEDVLESMTLRELEEVAEGLDHPRFARKAKAAAWLLSLPDARERVTQRVSLRDRFLLRDLPPELGVHDVPALRRAWQWGREVCRLLEETWYGNQAALAALAYEDALTWTVELTEECCPECTRTLRGRTLARQRDVAPPSPVPAHLGCRCRLDVGRTR